MANRIEVEGDVVRAFKPNGPQRNRYAIRTRSFVEIKTDDGQLFSVWTSHEVLRRTYGIESTAIWARGIETGDRIRVSAIPAFDKDGRTVLKPESARIEVLRDHMLKAREAAQ